MDINQDQHSQSIHSNSEVPETRRLPLRFTGSAGEYFRIWIVNILLTLLTLGIYGAWAKVRTRRYFYANTLLDGESFHYLAKPGVILKGHLLVGAALLVLFLAKYQSPMLYSLVFGVALSVLPYLLFKAHRFRARNSAYRNIRFRFLGNVRGAYKTHAYLAFIGMFSLVGSALIFLLEPSPSLQAEPQSGDAPGDPLMGLLFPLFLMLLIVIIYPYFAFLQRRYFHGNMAYGKTESLFYGRAKPFYGIYLNATAAVFFGLLISAIGYGLTTFSDESWENLMFYCIVGLLILVIPQYVYARAFNYSWGKTQLGPVTFDVSLKAGELIWIRITNVLAIILSLGLLVPWAKVRRARYILPRTIVVLAGDIGAFEAAAVYKENAVGDTTADFFDWDIGW